ncbi:hypothetical protein ACH4U6_01380 [Streptomyces netropsis]|uniref:hypothetical protein n=1 Tax=Streptomyces netropsis TaxID=55404 RepID=UPI0037A6B1AC
MRGITTATVRKAVTAAVATAALATLTTGVPASAATGKSDARSAESASVHGGGRIFYGFVPDDDIRFTVDATSAPYSRPYPGVPALKNGLPTDAKGTVTISHWSAKDNKTMKSVATVDCLVTGDRTATVTATITTVNDPELADTIGERRGFSVYDGKGGRDRFGFSWGVGNLDTDEKGNPVPGRVGTCMAPAPFAPVVKGGFTVRHAELATEPPKAARGS